MSTSNIVIGIDLGTTNSCVAYYHKRKTRVLENREMDRVTPSIVFYTDKAFVVGKYAKKLSDVKPERGISEIKRLMGRKFNDPKVQQNLNYYPFQIEDNNNWPKIVIEQPNNEQISFTPQEISAQILKKIKLDVEAKLESPILKAVITVPAYFNNSQREATLEAAKLAGFEVLKLLNEPTAAALTYLMENEDDDDDRKQATFIVYDLGGGTFDVAILKRQGRNIDIIAVDGDTYLGGHDFDNLIIQYVENTLQSQYNLTLDRYDKNLIRNKAREAKEALSTLQKTSIGLTRIASLTNLTIPLTRKQFEDMANHLFVSTIDIMDRCLKNANIDKESIQEVILAGGSTLIPKVKELISKYFDGKRLNQFNHPDECVAEGAAIQAALLSANNNQRISEIRITDVTPLSLGIIDNVGKMIFVIKRNTQLPVIGTETLCNFRHKQSSMTFTIYEGERVNALKNRKLATLRLPLTPSPPRQCLVTLTMEVDTNSILKLTAREKIRNNPAKDITINYDTSHIDDSQVQNALKDAEENKEIDQAFIKWAMEKKYLIDYCSSILYNLSEKGLEGTHKEIRDYCNTTLELAVSMKHYEDDEASLSDLKKDLEERCKKLVTENNFINMPSYSTYVLDEDLNIDQGDSKAPGLQRLCKIN